MQPESHVGKRVKLISWPYKDAVTEGEHSLQEGALGTVISEAQRCVVVKWGCLSGPIAMRWEEIALASPA